MRGELVEGGYKVHGSGPWASGAQFADWAQVGFLVTVGGEIRRSAESPTGIEFRSVSSLESE
ncbi:hypothetical protein AYO38_11770 [bacterium SCGC AG-212-C10]|nr:hypothetical protein AYO38_11770 [bacterium SCGC AG-212-C10]